MNKRTKALQIPQRVKYTVYDRDGGRCIMCGAPGDPVAHYISRAQGGLGIEQNIVTLCCRCHREYDTGYTEYGCSLFGGECVVCCPLSFKYKVTES